MELKTYCLAGNPNCGKTTIYNLLARETSKTGNWPGVTAECREGRYGDALLADLPGTYSLSPYTDEEKAALGYITEKSPALIINVTDSTCLERSLYLTTQLMELDIPLLLVLNMADEARKLRIKIDAARLSEKLGIPVLAVSAVTGEGMAELEDRIKTAGGKREGRSVLRETGLRSAFDDAERALRKTAHPAFYSAKYLECGPAELRLTLSEQKALTGSAKPAGEDFGTLVPAARYEYISKCLAGVYTPGRAPKGHKADGILAGSALAFPLFMGIMYLVFNLSFGESLLGIKGTATPGGFLRELLSGGLTLGQQKLVLLFESLGASREALDFAFAGVLGGVGAVASFIPHIFFLVLFIAILEETGYMTRIAMIWDRPLRAAGLSGRAILPLITGFGCSVPAVLNTRTLKSRRERAIAILIIPFMSCSAKLPVYLAFSSVFFGERAVVCMYLIGMVMAAVSAYAMNRLGKPEAPSPFIMEMPPYRVPKARNIWFFVRDRLSDFIVRGGRIIFVSSLVISLLSRGGEGAGGVLRYAAEAFVPLFAPLGFGAEENGWISVAAVFAGAVSRENVISALGVLYGGASTFADALRSNFTPASALSFMVYNLLSVPCAAALSVTWKELGKKTVFAAVFWFAAAWAVSFAVYSAALFFCKSG